MSRRRISSVKSRAHLRRPRSDKQVKLHRFIGVDLGGGKSDNTSLAVLDFYPGQNKLFLTHIYDGIGQDKDTSSEQVLKEIISEHKQHLQFLCFDAPLKLPICIRCNLTCPGYDKCKEPEIQWMWRIHRQNKKKHKRAKLFTPYTQRVVEMYLGSLFDQDIYAMEALGSNTAPIAARAHFLKKCLKGMPLIEVCPRVSVLRIGEQLHVPKSHLKYYKHSVGGDESRQIFLSAMVKEDLVFIYQQDFQKLIDNANNFEAFISAYTGFLKFQKKTEKPPTGFPLGDGWIEIPSL